jgi:hypothetical protein
MDSEQDLLPMEGSHKYVVTMRYSINLDEVIYLEPMEMEPHRWVPSCGDALAKIPNDPQVFVEIVLSGKDRGTMGPSCKKLHETYVQHVPLTKDWVIERPTQETFVSAITWNKSRFESVSVKMERHLALFNMC